MLRFLVAPPPLFLEYLEYDVTSYIQRDCSLNDNIRVQIFTHNVYSRRFKMENKLFSSDK